MTAPTRTTLEDFLSDPKRARLFYREGLQFAALEEICRAMKERGVTRSELARRHGVTRPRITVIMKEDANLTLETLADLAFCLGHRIVITAVPLEVSA